MRRRWWTWVPPSRPLLLSSSSRGTPIHRPPRDDDIGLMIPTRAVAIGHHIGDQLKWRRVRDRQPDAEIVERGVVRQHEPDGPRNPNSVVIGSTRRTLGDRGTRRAIHPDPIRGAVVGDLVIIKYDSRRPDNEDALAGGVANHAAHHQSARSRHDENPLFHPRP